MNEWWLVGIVPFCMGVGFWLGINAMGRGFAMILYENGLCRECGRKTGEHHANCPIGRYDL